MFAPVDGNRRNNSGYPQPGYAARFYDVDLEYLIDHDLDETNTCIAPKGKHIFGTVRVVKRGQIVFTKQQGIFLRSKRKNFSGYRSNAQNRFQYGRTGCVK